MDKSLFQVDEKEKQISLDSRGAKTLSPWSEGKALRQVLYGKSAQQARADSFCFAGTLDSLR